MYIDVRGPIPVLVIGMKTFDLPRNMRHIDDYLAAKLPYLFDAPQAPVENK
jgi:hypothetical protein